MNRYWFRGSCVHEPKSGERCRALPALNSMRHDEIVEHLIEHDIGDCPHAAPIAADVRARMKSTVRVQFHQVSRT